VAYNKKVILRADGNSDIGLGHVMRCCALADMLKDYFDCCFYIRKPSKEIAEDIKKYCLAVFEMDDTISYEEEARVWISLLQGDEIVVLDGYNFNTQYQLSIKSKGCRLVCIDDIHAYHFVADVVINHAPGIQTIQYSAEPYTQFFLGTEYVLLRRMFLKEASKPRNMVDLNNSSVFICLGGADPKNITSQIVEEVKKAFPEKNISIVIGAAYMHLNTLQQGIKKYNNVLVNQNLQAIEMLILMRRCGIAITSASTVAFEYLCIKGDLFLIQTADNQEQIYKGLIEKNCAYPFEFLDNRYNNSDIIINQYTLIDGKSNIRLLNLFKEL
jgi:UDP-2,4-diacetamido-2,4,6-trideoxy-beta-L-altropyranose hydrolase